MYKPNFILVGGVSPVINKDIKDYVAKQQIAGNYDDIADILMQQFTTLNEQERKVSDGTRQQHY